MADYAKIGQNFEKLFKQPELDPVEVRCVVGPLPTGVLATICSYMGTNFFLRLYKKRAFKQIAHFVKDSYDNDDEWGDGDPEFLCKHQAGA